MAEELNLDKEDTVESVPITRFKEVSKKQIESAQENAKLAEEKAKLEIERDSANKEMSFYKDFSAVSGKYQGASEHTDEIKTKVLAGYTLEDATVSVLNKAGKLTPARMETSMPAGGSSSNPSFQPKTKSIQESSKDELRQAIIDNDSGVMEFLRTGR